MTPERPMTPDHESRQLLHDSARDWLHDTWPLAQVRALRDRDGIVTGADIWRGMIDLGWPGILVEEQFGGSGLGMTAFGALLDQTGRHLTPSPLLSTALIGVSALSLCAPTDLTRDLLTRIAAGSLTTALAIDESAHHRPAVVATRARRSGNGWLLTGRKELVAHAASADKFIVSARTDDHRLGVFVLDAQQVSRQALVLIDSGDYGVIRFDDAAVATAALLDLGTDGNALLDAVLDRARIGLAAEMLGSAWAAFDMTIGYLKIREQFGQFIGSFQALQHRAAAMYVELELARSAVDAALHAVDAGAPDIAAVASRTKALVGDVLHHVTNEAIQLHGGIGMTDEHDAGLYLKRARVAEHLYGNAAFHRDRFARLRGF